MRDKRIEEFPGFKGKSLMLRWEKIGLDSINGVINGATEVLLAGLASDIFDINQRLDNIEPKRNKETNDRCPFKLKTVLNGYPDSDRDVMVLLENESVSVGWYGKNEGVFRPANVVADSEKRVEFMSDVVAWAELPEVDSEGLY